MKRRLISFLLATSMVLTSGTSALAVSSEEALFGDLEEEIEISEEDTGEVAEIAEDQGEDFGGDSDVTPDEDFQEELEEVLPEESFSDAIEEEILIDESSPEDEDIGDISSYFPEGTEEKSIAIGYRELGHKVHIGSLEGEDLSGPSLMSADEELEPYYVTPNLPPLQDQGDYGTCWAFSALSAAEINMMNNGALPWDYIPDYSKLHLAYFSYRTVEDPLGGTRGDYNGCYEKGTGMLNLGGNVFLAENVLANWTGAASEEVLPYSECPELNETIIDEGLAYDDMAHLQGYYDQEYSSDNLEPIKNLIKKCGAVSISFYAINPFSGGTDYAVYNAKYNSYYNPEVNCANHAVSVVGWDDNFPKENFSVKPPEDGAWLVRNSWTNGELEDSQEYDGYFWMSYYEGSLYDYVHAFDFESADNYDNNYQYDGGMDVESIYAKKAANVFTSRAPGGAGGETLEAVGFYSGYADTDYIVSVYTDLTDAATNPESGKLVSSVTGRLTYAGFTTVKLDTPVILSPDTVFSVVVELMEQPEYEDQTDDSRKGYFGYECEANSWYTVETSAEPGQSFLKTDIEAEWSDFGQESSANIKIKAYTRDNDGDLEDTVAPTEIVFDADMEDMVLGISESRRIKATVLPSSATSKKLEYFSSDDSIVSIVKGYLYGKGQGTATITARATIADADGNYAQNSFNVTVEPRLLGFTIDGCEDLEMGKEYDFNLKSIPKEAELPDDTIWLSSDPKVAEVDIATGRVTAHEVGSTMISALCGDESESIFVWVYPEAPVELQAKVDRFNNVTLLWESSRGAQKYEIVRNGLVVKKITASANKDEYSFVDTSLRGNFESEELNYAVRSVRKDFWICETLSVQTYEKIELDPDGGTCDKTYAVRIPGQEPVSLPIPGKKGYNFTEWEDFADNQLIARYTPITYSISFDGNCDNAEGVMTGLICEYDREENLPECEYINTDGLDFAGWNTRPDGKGKSIGDGAAVKNLSSIQGSDVTLYAQWEEAKRTVTFDTMGGSKIAAVTVTPKEMVEAPERTPVKSGFVFGGWFVDSDLVTRALFPMKITEDITLYAKWDSTQKTVRIEGPNDASGGENVLYIGSKEGREGYSLEFSAGIVLGDESTAKEGGIIWTTSDYMVAGFMEKEGGNLLSRIRTDGSTGNKVTVAIYSEDTDLDGYADKWPEEGRNAYIYATSATDGAVYGSVKVVVKDPSKGNVKVGDYNEFRIMHGDTMLASSTGSAGETLTVVSGKETTVTAVALPEDSFEKSVNYTSANIAVATVSSDGVVKGKSAGTTVITAALAGTGLEASFRVSVNEEITGIVLSDSSLKVGEGKNFEIEVTRILPSTGSGEIQFSSSNEAVVEFNRLTTNEDGRPVAVFAARGKGKTVITATAGSATAKCSVQVGNPLQSIEISAGKGMVAVDKTLKITAKFNGGNKKLQPLNKDLKWQVTNLDGSATDKAVINEKTGKLTAIKPGCVRVSASCKTEGVTSAYDDSSIVRIYVPVKKAALSVSDVSIKPGGEYVVALEFTPASVEGYPCTGGYDENGEAIAITDMADRITWNLKDNDYVSCEELTGGRCRLVAVATESKGTITLKAGYLPYGATKAKTISCKVKVTNNAVSKIALSKTKITMGRGADATISARLTPTAPEESGVVWTIPSEYAQDICFLDGDTELELLQLTTSLDLPGGNTVRIRTKENTEVKNKTVKLLAETVAANKKGVHFKATCSVVIYGNANCIEFTGINYTLQKGKSFTPKATAYLVIGEEKIKSGIQKFTYKSEDTSVATVNRSSGKVTAVGAGSSKITATSNDGSGLTASFTVRVFEPVTSLTIDKASFYMGLKNEDAESEAAAAESALASYNFLTPVVLPEGAFGDNCSFTWTISNSAAMETAVLNTDTFAGVKDVTSVQRILAGMDNGSSFASNSEVVTGPGEGLALKAVTTGTVNITVTSSNGKKASCTVKINAHVNGINVITDYKAIPEDGNTDNVAFNEAIKKAHENSISGKGYTVVYVPGGTYDIEAFNTNEGSSELTTGIHMLSGVSLIMDSDAILKVKSNGMSDYGVICVRGEKLNYGNGEVVPDNVVISGGEIAGEGRRHSGSGGEGGHGIYLAGACNVTISDMFIHDNWGDGIYIGTRALFKASIGCRNITVQNCDIAANCRNGISIVDLGTDTDYKKGLKVENCIIRDSHGHAPQCGIYVEPNNKPKQDGYVQSEFIICDTIYVKDTDINAYQGKNDAEHTCFMTHRDPKNTSYVTARDITFDHCRIKGWFGNYSGQNLKLTDTSISGEKILGSNR